MSVSAEKYLISSVIRNGDMKVANARGVTSAMFHAFPEEWAWLEAFYMKHKKTPSKIAFREAFDDFNIKAVDDTSHFADEVRKGHSRFLMTTMMKDCADLIADGKIESAVELAHINMSKIGGAMGVNNDTDILSDFTDIYADVERRVERVRLTGSSGIPTGFPTLDDRTGGPGPGEFWVVAARLGQGKSWTMQRMATAAVMGGYNVQYDALEQTRAQVAFRVHAFLASGIGESIFKTSDLMQGRNFDPKEYRRFLKKLKGRVKGNLHVADTSRGRVGVMTVRSQIERNKPDIVFVDYLGLMDKKGFEHQDFAALSGGLTTTAGEYELPIVAANQLNRAAGMAKDPGPEALSGSDAIGQDASAVITIKQNSPSTMTMAIPKNRNGVGGFKWFCHFNPGDGIFEEVSYERWMDLKDIDADTDEGHTNGKRKKTLK